MRTGIITNDNLSKGLLKVRNIRFIRNRVIRFDIIIEVLIHDCVLSDEVFEKIFKSKLTKTKYIT